MVKTTWEGRAGCGPSAGSRGLQQPGPEAPGCGPEPEPDAGGLGSCSRGWGCEVGPSEWDGAWWHFCPQGLSHPQPPPQPGPEQGRSPFWRLRPSPPRMGRSSPAPFASSSPRCRRTACRCPPSSGLPAGARGSGRRGRCSWGVGEGMGVPSLRHPVSGPVAVEWPRDTLHNPRPEGEDLPKSTPGAKLALPPAYIFPDFLYASALLFANVQCIMPFILFHSRDFSFAALCVAFWAGNSRPPAARVPKGSEACGFAPTSCAFKRLSHQD